MNNDNELMIQVQKEDFDKLGVLFERHKKNLFGYFYKVTFDRDVSEDLIQEVFMRILKYRKSFLGHGKFTTWMYSIAHNASVDYFRKRKNYVSSEDPGILEQANDHSSEEMVMKNEELDVLTKAMLNLVPEKREILILSKIDGLRYRELAKILNCSESAVKVRIFRALSELRGIYSKMEGQEL